MERWLIVTALFFPILSCALEVLRRTSVVIAGAGPAGLTAALMLESHGFADITVIEKRCADSFEYERAYSYMLAPNGMHIMEYLNLTSRVASRSAITADFTTLTVVKSTAEVEAITVPLRNRGKDKYWLSRPDLLEVLLDRVQEINVVAEESGEPAPIKILFNTTCAGFQLTEDGRVSIRVSQEGTQKDLTASILIGCDGVNSGNTSQSINAGHS
jgi:2-polyprenyl-6-methoxyphenol hydroxylase-like FAD-dependent oxidoreductase